jgi:hypothetical protein
MADNKPIPATLELVYVPDTYTETERQEGASWPLGSGFYHLVVVAGDARVVLREFKAGQIDKLLALGKQRNDAQAQASQPQPASAQQQEQPAQASQQTQPQTLPPPEPQQTQPQ